MNNWNFVDNFPSPSSMPQSGSPNNKSIARDVGLRCPIIDRMCGQGSNGPGLLYTKLYSTSFIYLVFFSFWYISYHLNGLFIVWCCCVDESGRVLDDFWHSVAFLKRASLDGQGDCGTQRTCPMNNVREWSRSLERLFLSFVGNLTVIIIGGEKGWKRVKCKWTMMGGDIRAP